VWKPGSAIYADLPEAPRACARKRAFGLPARQSLPDRPTREVTSDFSYARNDGYSNSRTHVSLPDTIQAPRGFAKRCGSRRWPGRTMAATAAVGESERARTPLLAGPRVKRDDKAASDPGADTESAARGTHFRQRRRDGSRKVTTAGQNP
jgi:hypothetical protein